MLALDNDKAFEFYRSFLRWYCDWYKPTYLEIGCAGGSMTMTLNTAWAVGVDIESHADWDVYRKHRASIEFYKMTSDKYFELYCNQGFGLVFIDGDHSKDQVLKDTYNALNHLSEEGLICLHDTYPPDVGYTHEQWSGTAYKAAIELRKDKSLEVYTFPVTYGLTLVSKIGQAFPWV